MNRRNELNRHFYNLIAKEISSFSPYFDRMAQWMPLQGDAGTVFRELRCRKKIKIQRPSDFSQASNNEESDLILLNGNVNHELDIQTFLRGMKKKSQSA